MPSKALQAQRRAANLCQVCGKEPRQPGRKSGRRCIQRNAAYTRGQRLDPGEADGTGRPWQNQWSQKVAQSQREAQRKLVREAGEVVFGQQMRAEEQEHD